MKKFLAFLMVAAMLTVSCAAMASTITVNPSTVTVVQGSTASARLSAQHPGGRFTSVAITPTASWVSVGDTAIAFSPTTSVTAQSYTFTITATEIYSSGDEVGHGGDLTEDATGTVTVVVSAFSPTPTPTPTPEEDTSGKGNTDTPTTQQQVVETTTTETVTVSVPPAAIVTETTAEDLKKPASEVAATAIDDTVTEEEATVYAAQVASLDQNISTKLEDRSSGSVLGKLFTLIGNIVGQTLQTVQRVTADTLQMVTDTTRTTTQKITDAATRLAQAAAQAKANGSSSAARMERQVAVAAMDKMKPTSTGFVTLPMPKFSEAHYGKKPKYNSFKSGGSVSGAIFGAATAFFAADDEEGEAVFLDSTGAQVDVIPGESGDVSNPNGSIPGFLTVVTFVEAGAEYDPVISVEMTDEEKAELGVETASVDVEVTTTETVTVNATKTFNPVVSLDVREAIGAVAGYSLDLLPYTAASSTWTATTAQEVYMLSNDLVEVLHLPVLNGIADNSADHAYIAKVWFNTLSASDLSFDNLGAPAFYPDGVVADGQRAGKLYKMTEVGSSVTPVEITASNAKTFITSEGTAYLVFRVAGGAVTTSDAEFEAATVNLTAPSVVVKGSDNTPTPTPTPEEDEKGVGKASGGCSAGSAVLALALLGAFISTRKK